ncbi:RNA ligase family protein [Kitasatospora sp. DSM 101779]|uniref:RNA ligase family protein n=1 Tax=Kitasatospora sp. DSM 101779 TaxID=2853165 RepID=UPI0021D98325|nr:RNA ligase family protein [Kitasatospora sp. DSM 101779]MCU7822083.1 AAA family ATPase [Kitasatospora sp. DSM 101779]
MRVSYPRTPHLPWSPGASADDVRTGGLDGLRGREVVVTEKLDGENTTLYRDGLHARSLDSGHHPSRAWVKALQGRIGPAVPAGWRVCGENLFARHSLAYRELDSWFYGFSVWDDTDHCLGWDDTVRFLRRLGVPAPRVLWRGVLDEKALRALRLDTEQVEGYVVRTVGGFPRAEFGQRVAKWVRPHHVQTDTHWMHAAVVENGLGPSAALWAVRSGAPADLPALLGAAGLDPEMAPVAEAAVAEVSARLDVLGRRGDARLAGVLAAAVPGSNRAGLAAGLAGPLGMPLARRVADLVGLHPVLQRPYPDEDRRAGLVRLAQAADLGVLHALAAAVTAGRADPDAADAREQSEWSALHAEDAGLLGEAPLAALRTGLGAALADLGPDAADRCWAEAREAFALGRVTGVEDAVAAAWRWRSGGFPQLVQLVGPSGSGKSVFADGLPGAAARISLDGLREERGDRGDQRANGDVLRGGLDRLDAALARGGTVVWDATSLNRQQRSLVQGIAQRRDALVTQAVLLVGEAELVRRNAVRPHPVPSGVLARQLRRFGPPYAGEAHRTWYVGEAGAVEDTAGTIGGEDA